MAQQDLLVRKSYISRISVSDLSAVGSIGQHLWAVTIWLWRSFIQSGRRHLNGLLHTNFTTLVPNRRIHYNRCTLFFYIRRVPLWGVIFDTSNAEIFPLVIIFIVLCRVCLYYIIIMRLLCTFLHVINCLQGYVQ